MDLDLPRLRQFLAVAESLSFTRAAQQLHIAQPALSRQIIRLERELGTPLFDRTHRQVQLTPAGRVLLAHARALVESSARARRDVDRAARGELGSIVVGFTQTVGFSLLPEAIRSYRTRNPGITLDIREVAGTENQTDLLLRDVIDVGISHYPSSERVLVRSEFIRSEPYSFVAVPADGPLATKRSIDLRDLAHERIIAGPAANPSAEEDAQLALDIAAAAGSSALPDVIHTSDVTTRLVLVATGVGVTLLLGSVPRVAHPGIAYRPLTGSRQTISLYASLRSDERGRPVLAFVDELRTLGRQAAGGGARGGSRPRRSRRRSEAEREAGPSRVRDA